MMIQPKKIFGFKIHLAGRLFFSLLCNAFTINVFDADDPKIILIRQLESILRFSENNKEEEEEEDGEK
jgi:hypothetical protein